MAIATTQQRSSKPSLPAISTSTRHPNAGNNLNQQLDQIAQSLAPSNIKDAAQKTADLLQQLDGPKKGGRVSSAELALLTARLQPLAALLPAVPGPPH